MLSEESKGLVRRLSQDLEAGNLTLLDTHPGLAEIKARIVQELAAGHSILMSEIFVEGEWVLACAVTSDSVSEVLGMYRIVDGKIASHHA